MKLLKFYILFLCSSFFSDSYCQNNSTDSIKLVYSYLESLSSYGSFDLLNEDERVSFQEAIQICSYFLTKELDSLNKSEFLYHRGRLYCKRRNIDSAIKDLEDALAYNIKNNNALDRLSFLASNCLKGYKKRKTYINDNVNAWKKSTLLDSNNAFNWYNLAISYGFQRDFNLANNDPKIINCYKKCINIDSFNDIYYSDLSAYFEMEEKEILLKKALYLNEYWVYRSQLINLYINNYKNFEKAMQLISESFSIYEKSTPINNYFISILYFYKSEIYLKQKKMDLYKIAKKQYEYYRNLN